MSQTDQLVNLVDAILHASDKNQRESAEATLVQLRAQPNELMICFLEILAGIFLLM